MFDEVTGFGDGTFPLGTGTLNLTVRSGPDEPIFQLAERINPKRAFLFVSTLLGRHVPVRPSDHFRAIDSLVERCDPDQLEGPVLVMGYAETAVGIGAAVARGLSRRAPAADLLYLSTTRHPVPGREWVRFSEGHSHATEHHVLNPGPHPALDSGPVTLVLVDDETTTGATFAALGGALAAAGVRIKRVLLVTLTDWSDGAASKAVSAIAPGVEVRSVSLLDGSWSWTPDPASKPPKLPEQVTPAYDLWVPTDEGSPRSGISCWSDPSLDEVVRALNPERGEELLIIGTGEQVWGPMVLAERLEGEGANVKVIATTRSPILLGDVIRHKVTFPDHFGVGVPMYLHNVPSGPSARVVVVTETGADRICPTLRSHLGSGLILDGSGQLTEFGV